MLFLPDDDQIRFAWAVAADGMMSICSPASTGNNDIIITKSMNGKKNIYSDI